jgi:hypothetical protein
LQKECAEFKRHRVEAAREHDARATGFCGGFMPIDHLPHPNRLTAKIKIVGAVGRAAGHKIRAVKLVWADVRDHRPGLAEHCRKRRQIACIGND